MISEADAKLYQFVGVGHGGDGENCPDPNVDLIQYVYTNNAATMKDGQVRYGLVCNATGTRGPMPKARSDEVLTRYRLPPGSHPDYEIDHLVPLCLGGADDASNLWPQPRRSIEPEWNAETKDRLERTLCALVCDKLLDIGDAQEAIIKDRIAAYHLYNE